MGCCLGPVSALVAGVERADSWANDAHKTLNVPYDSGLAIVAKAEAMYAAMGVHAAYLIQDERPDPFSTVPSFLAAPVVSRSGPRCVRWVAAEWPRWWSGSAPCPSFRCRTCRDGWGTRRQRCGVHPGLRVVRHRRGDARGSHSAAEDGTAWMTPSTWHGQAVLRISVSNWRTTDEDVERTLAAVRRVLAEVRAG